MNNYNNQQNIYQNQNQLLILLKKNWNTFKRLKWSLVFLLIGPILINFIIILLQYLTTDYFEQIIVNPPLHFEEKLNPCSENKYFSGNKDDCMTIGIGIIGENKKWIKQVQNYISDLTDLEIGDGKDIQTIYQGNDPKATEYFDYLKNNKSKVMVGIIFCTSEIYLVNETISCTNPEFLNYQKPGNPTPFENSYFYNLVINNTRLQWNRFDTSNYPLPYDLNANTVKALVDNAIAKIINPNFKVLRPEYFLRQSYPWVTARSHENQDVIAMFGSFYFFIMPMYIFILVLQEFIFEKVYKLRQGLNIFGVSHINYWLSWIITGMLLSAIISLYIILLGYCFTFKYFLQTNFIILFSMFFLFTFSLVSFSLVIATLVSSINLANSICYIYVLVSIVLEILLAQPFILNLIYDDKFQDAVFLNIFKFILSLYPPYVYSMIFQAINRKSGYFYDSYQNAWVLGPGFGFSDLTKEQHGEYNEQLSSGTYTQPSCLAQFGYLLLQITLFSLLALYFDAVIDQNRGVGKNFTFLCEKRTYQNKKYKKIESNSQHSLNEQLLGSTNREYNQSSQESLENNNNSDQDYKQYQTIGKIQIKNLHKTYQIFKCCKKKQKQAIKQLNLEIYQEQILGLLGHNGSGKTTLINILTGILENEKGSITINGMDTKYQMEKIRKIIGVCPQFDILWDYFTAAEHFQIYGQIKQLSNKYIQQITKETLKMVNLYDKKDIFVKQFSGGMKRRLSLALATIGNPKYLFLDEPTTGLDPNIRRQIWELIQQIKKDKGIILTTHSMEEADILSDQIAVLSNGELQCTGDTLHLKNKYGGGYRLHIYIDNQETEKIWNLLQQGFLSSQIISNQGGSMIITIPYKNNQNLINFMQVMENNENPKNQIEFQKQISSFQQLKPLIKDWQLSHPTLEEVFMKVTKSSLLQ